MVREEQLITAAITQAADAGVALHGVAEVINGLSDYLYLGGHWGLGLTLFRHVLAISRQEANPASEGQALNNLGKLIHSQGRFEEAAGYYMQALEIAGK